VAVCLVCLTVVGVVTYQSERPLREIEAALKSGQSAQALKLASQYLRDHPDDVRAQVLRARSLVEIGQLSDALRIFQSVGASEPADLHAWAKAHLLRQEWSDALPVLRQILQANPNDPDALHEMTACQSFVGNYPQAFESAKKLAMQPGHEARAWLQIGTLHENLGNDRSTIESWEKVLQYDPRAEHLQVSAADFFGEYGRILIKDGKPEKAREALERSLTLRESPDVRALLGDAFQQLGDEALAADNWKAALLKAPALREPREFLAQAAFRAGKYDEARNWLEPALATNPPSSSTYLMQRICTALQQRDEAAQWQQRTEEIRKREKYRAAINHTLVESPESFWARAIRAYQFAEAGNWRQAEVMTDELVSEASREPFVRELAACVRNRGPLPSLDLLPLHQF
jgi:tetratricopeptide (TPR) repeat protein